MTRKENNAGTVKSRLLAIHQRDRSLTAIQIAEELGTCDDYTRRMAKSLGLNLPRSGTRSWRLQDWEKTAIVEAYRDGEKLESVAVEFGVSPSYVFKISRRAGCALRSVGWLRTKKPLAGELNREAAGTNA